MNLDENLLDFLGNRHLCRHSIYHLMQSRLLFELEIMARKKSWST